VITLLVCNVNKLTYLLCLVACVCVGLMESSFFLCCSVSVVDFDIISSIIVYLFT